MEKGEGVLGRRNSICKGSEVGTVQVCAGNGVRGQKLTEARRGDDSHHENRIEARESSSCLMNLRGIG